MQIIWQVSNIEIKMREDVVVWTGLVWLKTGQVESSCEFGTEPSGSMKCWETIEWPNI
jgi:hypothetical protein